MFELALIIRIVAELKRMKIEAKNFQIQLFFRSPKQPSMQNLNFKGIELLIIVIKELRKLFRAYHSSFRSIDILEEDKGFDVL